MVVGCGAYLGGVEGSSPAVASELLQKHVGKTGAAHHNALTSDILNMKGCTIKEKDQSSVNALDENVDYYLGHQQVEEVASQMK